MDWMFLSVSIHQYHLSSLSYPTELKSNQPLSQWGELIRDFQRMFEDLLALSRNVDTFTHLFWTNSYQEVWRSHAEGIQCHNATSQSTHTHTAGCVMTKTWAAPHISHFSTSCQLSPAVRETEAWMNTSPLWWSDTHTELLVNQRHRFFRFRTRSSSFNQQF